MERARRDWAHKRYSFQRAHREGLEVRWGEMRRTLRKTLEKLQKKEATMVEVVKKIIVQEAKDPLKVVYGDGRSGQEVQQLKRALRNMINTHKEENNSQRETTSSS